MTASIKTGLLAVISGVFLAGAAQAYTIKSMVNNDDGTGNVVLQCGDGSLVTLDYITQEGGRVYFGGNSRGTAGNGYDGIVSYWCENRGG